MPKYPPRICVQTGCGARFTPIRRTQRRCPDHHPDYIVNVNATKNQRPIRAIYDSAQWRTVTRPLVLRRDNGICNHCGKPGHIVDHIDGIEAILARSGNPYDPDECQTLCAVCSGAKDGSRSRGGSGAAEGLRHPTVSQFSASHCMRGQSDAEVWAA